MKIILDTNALVYAVKYKMDIASLLFGYELLVPKQVISELEHLSGKGADKMAAKLAIQLASKLKKVDIGLGKVDSQIVKFAKKEGAGVLTNDLELRKRCEAEKIRVFFVRQNKLIDS